MARFKYVRAPYGYSNPDLTINVREYIKNVGEGEFHRMYRIFALANGYAAKRLPASLKRQFLESIGKEWAKSKHMPVGSCRKAINILLAEYTNMAESLNRK